MAAREALAAGKLDEAERRLAASKLSKEPWTADLSAEVTARRLRAMQPDTFDAAAVKSIDLKMDNELCADRHPLGIVARRRRLPRRERRARPARPRPQGRRPRNLLLYSDDLDVASVKDNLDHILARGFHREEDLHGKLASLLEETKDEG